MAEMFDNISGLQNLATLEASSYAELESILKSIRLPTEIIQIVPYGNPVGSRWVAFIRTMATIKKVQKTKEK